MSVLGGMIFCRVNFSKMLAKKPLISVIVRSYNSASFMRKALDSALNQTLDKKCYEVLVIDDGSQDNTIDILENEYARQVRLVKQNHMGLRRAVYEGIRESRGKYIIFLDSDDEFKPEILKRMIDVFQKDPLIDFVYCDYFEKNEEITTKVLLKNNIFNSLWCAIMFKKELFEDIGLPDENLFFAEYEFLIRLINNGKIGKHIPEPLYIYYRGKSTLTSDKKMVEKGIKQIREKYGSIADKIRKY